MKFTGLILICASSCLALILPAIGVVHFPQATQHSSAGQASPTFATSTPAPTPQFPGPTQSNVPNPSQWKPALPQRDFLPESLNSAPQPSTTSPFSSGSLEPSRAYPPQVAETNLQPTSTPAGQKFGMGIWLLLAPVCLIGLALWTFSPNPSGVKK